MLSILYFGDSSLGSTSAHRAHALRRLGHKVEILDPYIMLGSSLQSLQGVFHYRTGYVLLQKRVAKWVGKVLDEQPAPALVWIDSGELFGPQSVRVIKSKNLPTVLYNIDDPTGKRDGRKFDALIRSLPLYDLVVVVRKETEKECADLGAKAVMRVSRSYDEVAHHPFENNDDIPEKFKSEVVFIGTWMRYEKRDEFLLDLIQQGVPVSIWGDRWQKSPHLLKLKPHLKGGSLSGREYVAAVQGAKVCLGLLSQGNRDLHTTRSLEVPYAGGLLCAKRTIEHEAMYKDGVEAVFWSDAAECARQCKRLLADDNLREGIRQAGMSRVRALGVGNEDVCKSILNVLISEDRSLAKES